MYRNILVATDGSDTANMALKEALIFAKAGATVTAVMVVSNPFTSYGLAYGDISYDYESVHQELIDRADGVLKGASFRAEHEDGVQIKTELIDLSIMSNKSDISNAIEKAADQTNADLIVIGTHGRGGFKRFFLGSVTEHLIRLSKHPVLIVRMVESTK